MIHQQPTKYSCRLFWLILLVVLLVIVQNQSSTTETDPIALDSDTTNPPPPPIEEPRIKPTPHQPPPTTESLKICIPIKQLRQQKNDPSKVTAGSGTKHEDYILWVSRCSQRNKYTCVDDNNRCELKTHKETAHTELCNAKNLYKDRVYLTGPLSGQFIWFTPLSCLKTASCTPGRCLDSAACGKYHKWSRWCTLDPVYDDFYSEFDVAAAQGSTITQQQHDVETNRIRGTYPAASLNLTGFEPAQICLLSRFYGRHANRMVTLANAIRYSSNGIVRLGPRWSRWFKLWFDPVQSVSIHLYMDQRDYGQACKHIDARYIFYKYSGSKQQGYPKMGLFNPGFSKLYLQPMLLQEASNALKVYAHNNEKSSGHTATVHARWLEGECETRQKAGQTYCRVGDKDFFTYESCAYTEEYIKQHLPLALSKASIVLCADQEHPLSEETFHNIDTHSYQVQFGMMATSDFHFGNPASTVDYVIAHFRNGRSQSPILCYSDVIKASAATHLN